MEVSNSKHQSKGVNGPRGIYDWNKLQEWQQEEVYDWTKEERGVTICVLIMRMQKISSSSRAHLLKWDVQ